MFEDGMGNYDLNAQIPVIHQIFHAPSQTQVNRDENMMEHGEGQYTSPIPNSTDSAEDEYNTGIGHTSDTRQVTKTEFGRVHPMFDGEGNTDY